MAHTFAPRDTGRYRAAGRVLPWVLAALLMAGDFKSELDFLPFDLTLSCAALVGLGVLCRLVRRSVARSLRVELVRVAVGFGVLVPSVLIAEPTDYGSDKVVKFFVLTLLAVLAPVVLVQHSRDIERQVWAVAGLSGLLVLSSIVRPREGGVQPGAAITAAGVDTVGLGSAAGLLVVVAVLGAAWRRVPWWMTLPVGGAGVYALLSSGSRGPLIATVLAVAAGALLGRVRPGFARVATLGGLCVLGLLAAFAVAPPDARERILAVLLGRTVGTDVETRQSLYAIAARSIAEHPFGIGWGNFEDIAFGNYRYPHDLVLEVLCEAGVLYGGLFLIWLLVHAWRARHAMVDHAGALVVALVVFTVAGALVSGDLNDNRRLFFTLGLAIAARALVDRRDGVARCGPAERDRGVVRADGLLGENGGGPR